MKEIEKQGYRAHAATAGFCAKVERAKGIILRSLPSRPYVAFSGGKDSLVCLSLAKTVKPDIAAMWNDNELEYHEQDCYMREVCDAMGIRLHIKTGGSMHGGWFVPWVEQPFFREKLPGIIEDRRPSGYAARELGYNGVILGLRRQESSKRQLYLSKAHELYEVSYGMTLIHPIAGWTAHDVWAYIVSRDLYYNPVYDRLMEIGTPVKLQRVGPLPLTPGGVLRAGWPEMYQRLIARYGNKW